MKHHDGLLNTAAETIRSSKLLQSQVHMPEVVCDITQILGVRKVVQEDVNIRPILLVHETEGDVQIGRAEKPFHSTSGVLRHLLHGDVVGRHGCRYWGGLNKGETCDRCYELGKVVLGNRAVREDWFCHPLSNVFKAM